MNRTLAVLTFAATLGGLIGCEKSPAEAQREADRARDQAQKENVTAQQKADQAQAQAEKDKQKAIDEANKKTAEADQKAAEKMANAQKDADKKIGAAQRDSARAAQKFNAKEQQLRNEFRRKADEDLSSVEGVVSKVEDDVNAAKAKAADVDRAAVKDIREKTHALRDDVDRVAGEPDQTFDASRAKVRGDIDALKKRADDLKKHE